MIIPSRRALLGLAAGLAVLKPRQRVQAAGAYQPADALVAAARKERSEERRVGKECA